MNQPFRTISKYGGLQTKKRKKGGTLIRKPKYIFESEQWVALCVHKQQIPLLEWYPTANDILEHQPIKVLDLLECLYVELTVGDDRCFNIGFVDENRPAVEFAARTTEEARDWVKEIKKCLRELHCLRDSANEYQAMPVQRQPNDETYEAITPGFIHAEPSPPLSSPIRNRVFYNLNAEIPLPLSPAPSIPPRAGGGGGGQQNHATSSPIRIPSPNDLKFNNAEQLSPPPSPTDSPPQSPRLAAGVIAILPPRRSAKNSISSNPQEDEEVPPPLPPRRNPLELSTSVPLSPTAPLSPTVSAKENLKTNERRNSKGRNSISSSINGNSNGDGNVIKGYDSPLSPLPSDEIDMISMNEKNLYSHCYSPTSPPASSSSSAIKITKFRSPKFSFGNISTHSKTFTSPNSTSTPSARTTSSMNPSISDPRYELLPQAPSLPPPNLSPSVYETPMSSSNTDTEKRRSSNSNNNNIYNQPQPIYTKFTFPPDSSIASTSDESDYRRLSNEISQLRMSLISSSTEDSNDSTKSQPPEPPTIPPRPPKLNSSITNSLNYAGSFREKKAVTTEISLLLSICLESLLLAEVAGSIWIAGWSESQNSLLCHKIHVGDQLVEVNGIPVKQMKQFPSIFYNHSLPGQPIPLKIRTLPHGSTYLITKPSNVYTPRTFGIVLHKKKNRIDEIIPQTPAARAGLLPKQQPFLWGREYVSPVITEVNGIPLNPFATNELFYKRLERLTNGSEIQINVQPYDFCKLVKQQLKNIKNLKNFLQN